MSDTTAAATLTLEISTEKARAELELLEKKYAGLITLFRSDTTKIKGVVDAQAATDLTKLGTAALAADAQIRDLKTQVMALTDAMKAQSSSAAANAASSSAGIAGWTRKARSDLKEMSDSYKSVTDAILAESKKLANTGLDLSTLIKGQKLTQLESDGTVKSLSSLIKKLEEVKAVSEKTGGAPALITKQYGEGVNDLVNKLPELRAKLLEVAEAGGLAATSQKTLADATRANASAAQAAGNASIAKLLQERAVAANAAADAERRLADATRANASAAQAAGNASIAKLLQERATAANAAAEAERRLADATRANASAAQAAGNASIAKLLQERATAANAAADAERRLADATRANASAAQAAGNASIAKLLQERAVAANAAADAERRLADATRANASAAQAAGNASIAKLLQERATAANAAAEAERRLADATRANASAAQAAGNASIAKLLQERATAANAAADAERRLADATRANASAAQAAGNASIAKLLQERAVAANAAAEAERRLADATRANASAARAAYAVNTAAAANPARSTYNALMNTTTAGATTLPSAQNSPSVTPVPTSVANSYTNLSNKVKEASEHQLHWNKAANEAHALARGLSGSLGTLWMTYGSIAPLMAGAALGAGFVQAAKQGAEFAYQLTFVKALGEESASAINQLSEASLSLGKSSLQGPGEIASGFRILAQAGLAASDALRVMPDALHLATVGEMNMEQAATTLVGVMNAFSLSVDKSSHVGDIFAKAAALSQTSVQGMTEAMKTASVVGEQYGASIEDTATAITLLAKVNITGTAAGTSLRNMLKELYTPVPQASAAMRKLGLETKDAMGNMKPFPDIIYDLKERLKEFDKSGQTQILQRIFGERGAKEAIAMLSKTREEWEKLASSIKDSDGFMDGVSDALENTAKGKWLQAINTLKSELIGVFQDLEPEFKGIAEQMQALFSSSEFRQGLSSTVSAFGSLLSTLVELGPQLIKLAEVWVAFKAGSIAAALLTAGAAATAGSAAFTAFSGSIAASSLAMSGAMEPVAATATKAGALGTAFTNAGAAILAAINPVTLFTTALVGTAAWVIWQSQAEDAIDRVNSGLKRLQDSVADVDKLLTGLQTRTISGGVGKQRSMQEGSALRAEINKYKDEVRAAYGDAVEFTDNLNIKSTGPSSGNVKANPYLNELRQALLARQERVEQALEISRDIQRAEAAARKVETASSGSRSAESILGGKSGSGTTANSEALQAFRNNLDARLNMIKASGQMEADAIKGKEAALEVSSLQAIMQRGKAEEVALRAQAEAYLVAAANTTDVSDKTKYVEAARLAGEKIKGVWEVTNTAIAAEDVKLFLLKSDLAEQTSKAMGEEESKALADYVGKWTTALTGLASLASFSMSEVDFLKGGGTVEEFKTLTDAAARAKVQLGEFQKHLDISRQRGAFRDDMAEIGRSVSAAMLEIQEIEGNMDRDGGWVARLIGSEEITKVIDRVLPEIRAKMDTLRAELDLTGVDYKTNKDFIALEKQYGKFANYVTDTWKDITKSIDGTVHQAFSKIFSKGKTDWKAFGREIGDNLKTALLDALYQVFVRKWVFSVVADVSQGAGWTGLASAALDIANGRSVGSGGAGTSAVGLANNASSAYSLYGAATGYNSTVNTAASLVGAGSATGASAASLAYANGVGALGGDSLGALIAANGSWGGVAVGTEAAATTGWASMLGEAATGAWVLAIPAIAGAISAAGSRKAYEFDGVAIKGDYAGSNFTGSAATKWEADGGWWESGDKMKKWMPLTGDKDAIISAFFGGGVGAAGRTGYVNPVSGEYSKASDLANLGDLRDTPSFTGVDNSALVASWDADYAAWQKANPISFSGGSEGTEWTGGERPDGVTSTGFSGVGGMLGTVSRTPVLSTDPVMLAALDNAIDAIFKATQTSFKALADQFDDTDLAGKINDFSTSINLDTKSGDIDKVLAALASDVNAKMAQAFLPSIEALRLPEEAWQTAFNRVMVEVAGTSRILDMMGASIKDTFGSDTNAAITAIDGLSKAFGGIDNLSTSFSAYYANFYSAEEQRAQAMEDMGKSFEALNVTMPTTREGFRALVDSLDLSTTGGQATFKAMMDLQGVFANLVPAIDSSATSVEALAAAAKELADWKTSTLSQFSPAKTVEQAAQEVNASGLYGAPGSLMTNMDLAGFNAAIVEVVTGANDATRLLFEGQAGNLTIIQDYLTGIGEAAEQAAIDQTQGEIDTLLATFGDLAGAMAEINSASETLVDEWRRTKTELSGLVSGLAEALGEIPAPTALDNLKATLGSLASATKGISSINEQIYNLRTGAGDQAAIDLMKSRETSLFADLATSADPGAVSAELASTMMQRISAEAKLATKGLDDVARLEKDGRDLRIKSLQDQISATERLVDFTQSLKGFVADLKFSDLSALNPTDQLASAQTNYSSILDLARGGDDNARGNLQSSANSYLQEAQGYYGGATSQYAGIFGSVTGELDQFGATPVTDLTLLQEQLTALENITAASLELQTVVTDTTDLQIEGLNSINTVLTTRQDEARQEAADNKKAVQEQIAELKAIVAGQEAQIKQQAAIYEGLMERLTTATKALESLDNTSKQTAAAPV